MNDADVFPAGTVVRIKKTNEFALIKKIQWLRPESAKHFLHYEAEIEGKIGIYALYHQDLELECLPIS
jgi:hypothetical protein